MPMGFFPFVWNTPCNRQPRQKMKPSATMSAQSPMPQRPPAPKSPVQKQKYGACPPVRNLPHKQEGIRSAAPSPVFKRPAVQTANPYAKKHPNQQISGKKH